MNSLAQALRSRRESRRSERQLMSALAGIGSPSAQDELRIAAQRRLDALSH